MTTIGSNMVLANATPGSSDLWEPVALFSPNWSGPVTLQSRYRTVIEGSWSSAEHRFALVDSPGRSLSFSLGAYQADATHRLRSILLRFARARTPVPLYCDQTVLTGLIGPNTYSGDFTNRRFLPGGWFVSMLPSASGITDQFEFRRILTVLPSSIVLDAPLSSIYHQGSLAFPVLECQLELNLSADVVTDIVNAGQLVLTETVGPSALAATVASGVFTATIFDGHPILPFDLQWVDVGAGAFRLGERSQVGITSVVQLFGNRPGNTFTLPFQGRTRTESFALTKFFDGLRGRLRPFWIANPSAGLRLLSIDGGNTLHFAAPTSERDWETIGHLSVFRISTSLTSIHEITFSVEAAGEHLLDINPPLPSFTASDYLVSSAHLVRLDSDELEEEWVSDRYSRSSWPVVELLREMAADTTLDTLTGPGGGTVWTPNSNYLTCQPLCGASPGCVVCPEDLLRVQSSTYRGQNHPDADCNGACVLWEDCVVLLPFHSCVSDVARWQNDTGTIWAELDTATTMWGSNVGGLTCLPIIDDGGGLLTCTSSSLCSADLPASIETATCNSFRRELLCDIYGINATCSYVRVLLLEITPIGPVCE